MNLVSVANTTALEVELCSIQQDGASGRIGVFPMSIKACATLNKSYGIYLLLSFVVFLASVYGQDQTTEYELSNIEKLLSKSGTLVRKEFIEIGRVQTARVQALILTELITNAKMYGVRLEYEHSNRLGNNETRMAYLDQDEVDDLIKSIGILKSRVFNTAPDNHTEVAYSSRGGFELGCYLNKGQWISYLKYRKYDNETTVLLKQTDYDLLLDLLGQARQKFQ